MQADIGLIGLAVMGENLVLNLEIPSLSITGPPPASMILSAVERRVKRLSVPTLSRSW